MLRIVLILSCCLLPLGLGGCNRGTASTGGGRVYYKVEVEGEQVHVAFYNVASNQIRVKIPGRKNASGRGESFTGTMTHDGVKYTWNIHHFYPQGDGAVPEIRSVTLNNEVIPREK